MGQSWILDVLWIYEKILSLGVPRAVLKKGISECLKTVLEPRNGEFLFCGSERACARGNTDCPSKKRQPSRSLNGRSSEVYMRPDIPRPMSQSFLRRNEAIMRYLTASICLVVLAISFSLAGTSVLSSGPTSVKIIVYNYSEDTRRILGFAHKQQVRSRHHLQVILIASLVGAVLRRNVLDKRTWPLELGNGGKERGRFEESILYMKHQHRENQVIIPSYVKKVSF